MQATEFALRSKIAHLSGLVEGLTAWQRDRVWRRALLEKLLMMEGYDQRQRIEIMHGMKPTGPSQNEDQLRDGSSVV